MIEILDSTVKHIPLLLSNLKEQDKQEAIKLGFEPHKAIFQSYRRSLYRKTGFLDNKIVAMWGVSGTPLSMTGHPWLFVTNEIVNVKTKALIRVYRQQVHEMLNLFPKLQNDVDAGYHESMRLLKIAGFGLSKVKEINGYLFREFSRSE